MQAVVIAPNKEEREFLSFIVRQTGLAVATSTDIQRILTRLTERPVDLILIAANSSQDLVQLVQQVRAQNQTPLILLVEKLTEELHCTLLDAEADLVLERPFSPRILSRYMRMLIRRSGNMPNSALPTIEVDGLALNPTTRTVRVVGGSPLRLTQLEFRLLYVLMTNPAQVLSADQIVERVWGYDGEGNRDLVRGLVRRLRRKIEPLPNNPRFIHNITGVGYHFSVLEPEEDEGRIHNLGENSK